MGYYSARSKKVYTLLVEYFKGDKRKALHLWAWLYPQLYSQMQFKGDDIETVVATKN